MQTNATKTYLNSGGAFGFAESGLVASLFATRTQIGFFIV